MPYLSALEMSHDKALYKSMVSMVTLTLTLKVTLTTSAQRTRQTTNKSSASAGMANHGYKPPHHNRFMALFRDHPRELVPEENFWTL